MVDEVVVEQVFNAFWFYFKDLFYCGRIFNLTVEFNKHTLLTCSGNYTYH